MRLVDQTWLTAGEVATRLRVNPETVRRWLRQGKLRGWLASDSAGWRVAEAELERFLAAELQGGQDG